MSALVLVLLVLGVVLVATALPFRDRSGRRGDDYAGFDDPELRKPGNENELL